MRMTALRTQVRSDRDKIIAWKAVLGNDIIRQAKAFEEYKKAEASGDGLSMAVENADVAMYHAHILEICKEINDNVDAIKESCKLYRKECGIVDGELATGEAGLADRVFQDLVDILVYTFEVINVSEERTVRIH
jgi:hypothetical protein